MPYKPIKAWSRHYFILILGFRKLRSRKVGYPAQNFLLVRGKNRIWIQASFLQNFHTWPLILLGRNREEMLTLSYFCERQKYSVESKMQEEESPENPHAFAKRETYIGINFPSYYWSWMEDIVFNRNVYMWIDVDCRLSSPKMKWCVAIQNLFKPGGRVSL